MKMDTTQKRMLKVAIAYFLLTLFVVWKLFHCSDAWASFWFEVFLLLQPVLWFLVWIFHLISVPNGDLGGVIEFLEGVAMLFSVPLWSICFGWLYVKFTNWLNHFPVLGKKVF
jgi:hypothetical protein